MRSLALVLLLATTAAHAAEPTYNDISARFARAKEAVESGDVDPARDLAPLIALLRTVKDTDNRERIVDRLSDLGEADGGSPVAVKTYLLDEATPILIEIAGNTANKWSLRGSAIHALRDMGAPRATLQRIADMALKDSNSFVKSRGEIIQNYIQTMPDEPATAAIKPVDADREKEALAFLRERNVGVSADQLLLSAIEAKPEEVEALLAAGVDPNGDDPGNSPLDRAISGCSHEDGETDAVLETIDILLAAGARATDKDEYQNTPLLRAAQYCNDKVVAKLIAAGADVNAVNGSGTTPLSIALIMSHFEAAELLIAKGARFSAREVEMFSSNEDPRVKALVKKAAKK